LAIQQPSSTPRVSVALCTYNGAQFVAAQLESIARQTLPVDEIVVCDDGSNDQTVSIVKEFVARLPIRIEVNDRRLGVTGNFARAIGQCTGDIIFLCDQDDLWEPGKVERLIGCFADDSAGLVFSNAQVVGEDLSPAGYRLWDSIWFDAAEQKRMRGGAALPLLLRHAIAAGSTLAFRSRYLPLVLPIPDFPHSHDIWITLLIACVGRVLPLDEDLIRYRLHASNHVGLRRYGLLGQIRMATQQRRTRAFEYAADLHQAAYQRLTGNAQWPVAPQTLELLTEKIRHSRLRHDMPANPLSRLGIISSEIRNGNYSKYSYGYKSVLQDLMLR
jgi:glycosyltransferase involved in cell wall biosynthesis